MVIVISQPVTFLSFSIVCFAAYDQFLSLSDNQEKQESGKNDVKIVD
jgi:hypothetical protein